MLTPEQLHARRIGGSDVAAILGLDPYKTQYQLYLEKTGAIEGFDGNEASEAGQVLEDGIATLAERRMSKAWGRPVRLRRCNLTITPKKYDWLTVHIDRDVVGEDRGVEIKNVGWRMALKWGDPDSDHIPHYYLPQVHTYLLAKDYSDWTVAAYFGGADLRLYEVPRDREMDEMIIQATHDFWYQHVVKGVPPPITTTHETTLPLLKKLYPGTSGEAIAAPDGMDVIVAQWLQAKADSRDQDKRAKALEAEILAAMGDAAELVLPDNSAVTRRLIERAGYTVKPTSYMQTGYKAADKRLAARLEKAA